MGTDVDELLSGAGVGVEERGVGLAGGWLAVSAARPVVDSGTGFLEDGFFFFFGITVVLQVIRREKTEEKNEEREKGSSSIEYKHYLSAPCSTNSGALLLLSKYIRVCLLDIREANMSRKLNERAGY